MLFRSIKALNKLNSFSSPGENVRDDDVALARVNRAEMVRAFIESIEYRNRFGGAPGGNQEGSVSQAGLRQRWRTELSAYLRAIIGSMTGLG